MKVALITGAARGIGAAVAQEFAAHGYAVALCDVRTEELHETSRKLTDQGFDTFPIQADLESLENLNWVVDQVIEQRKRIDVLINNAATRDLQTIRQITPESWQRVIQVNLTAPAFLSQRVAAHMDTDGGTIINVTSVEANIPKGVAAAYSAAKGGLTSLTYDMAASLAGRGIRVVAVSPGAVDTALSTHDRSKHDSITPDLRAASEELIPLRRWAHPDEIAKVIRWLCSEEASYITGTEITVDGGLSHTWMPRSIKKRIHPDEF
jgi:NAD(P)-dependent dehydrogenase (short-subunit alcohol dehydrogenase family)